MKRLFILAVAALSGSWMTPAFGQAVTATLPVTCPPSGVNCVQATPVVNPDGTTISGGGAGGATAANQVLQITQETAVNTVLGTVTASPTANTIGDRLKVINTTLGTPLQAGGTVSATQSGTWNIGTVATITNALPAGTNSIGTVVVTDGSGTANSLTVDTAQLAATLGAKTSALSPSFTPASDATFIVSDGSGTANSLTVDSPQLPTTIGQKTGAASVSVVWASDATLPAGTNTIGTVLAQGNVASGAADTGTNPIKFGGRYNTTQPTLTDAQRGDAQLDTRGNFKIAIMDKDGVGGVAVNNGGLQTAVGPCAASGCAITPVVGSLVSNINGKGSAGNLYSVSITTGATAGYIYAFNSTGTVADGAVTAGTASGNYQLCTAIAASTTGTFAFDIPERYSVGVRIYFSTTACGTLTASATAVFIKARVN